MHEVSWDLISGVGLQEGSTSIPEWAENLSQPMRNEHTFDPILAQQGYTPLQLLGEGRDASVYLAWSEKDGHLVAIASAKGIGADSPEERRIMRDAEIRFKFPHPNIVSAIDVVVGQSAAYVVSEVVGSVGGMFSDEPSFDKGLNFSDNLARIRGASESPETALNRGLQSLESIITAVVHLHDNGIVHRDIKAANILCDSNGRPYLLDFGTALRPSEIPSDAKVEAVCSWGYAAPEVLKGEQRPHLRQDVYALGCLMYETITGKTPFFEKTEAARNPEILLRYIPATQDPMLPSTLNPTVSKELESVCMKAMHRDPEKRYKNAGEFLIALQETSAASFKIAA